MSPVRSERCRRLAKANGQLQRTLDQARGDIAARARERKGGHMTEGDLRQMSIAGVLRRLENRPPKERSILKCSDLWTFNPPVYGRVDGEDGHGYIPGDLYANILWYAARDRDLVAEVMAGSGQVLRVYEDRARWLPPGAVLDLDLRLFDLTPRGPYVDRIQAHDARKPLPCSPDLIIMDLPYYRIVRGAYSSRPDDLANAPDVRSYLGMVRGVATACRASQGATGRGRVVVVVPAYRDNETDTRVPLPHLVRGEFGAASYDLLDVCYSGRALQKAGETMKWVNADARKTRCPLAEVAEIQFYARRDAQ